LLPDYNNLSGSIPKEMGLLTSLEHVDFGELLGWLLPLPVSLSLA
jgi:hypothetical protein